MSKEIGCWEWWHRPLIPAGRSLEFNASLTTKFQDSQGLLHRETVSHAPPKKGNWINFCIQKWQHWQDTEFMGGVGEG